MDYTSWINSISLRCQSRIKMKLPLPSVIELFKQTPGAISVAEMIAIHNLAASAPLGVYMELGSHAGKSSIASSSGFERGKLYMVDPIYDLTNLEAWRHSVQGTPENMPWHYVNANDFYKITKEKITYASNSRVTAVLVGDYSEKAITHFEGYGYVFIDSDDHCGGMAIREAQLLENRMVKGGIIAFHDWGNQFQDPKKAHEYLISTGKFENIPINWGEIFDFVREHNLEVGNDSWHEKGSNEFPCYVGAVRRK